MLWFSCVEENSFPKSLLTFCFNSSFNFVYMELKITLWSLLLLFGCLQSVFLIAIFLLKKAHRHARNLLLCLLLFVFMVIEFDHSLRLSSLYKSFPNLIYISDGLWYLIAPTLFFIAKFYVEPSYRFTWLDLLHLVPFVTMQTLYFNLLTANSHVKVHILTSYKASGEYGLLTHLLILAMMVQILAYILASLKLFRRYQFQYEVNFSTNQLEQLSYFKGIYRFFLLYFLLEFSFSTFRNFTAFESNWLDNWSLVVWTFFIYGIAYIAMLNPTKLLPQLPSPTSHKIIGEDKNEVAELQRILDYMVSSKAFRKSDLSLPELAESLNLSTNRTSYLINQVHGKSFYNFINTYRVKEVKEQLEKGNHKQMSIIGISQDAGFKSKTSFYKFFKHEFAVTPTQFISRLEND